MRLIDFVYHSTLGLRVIKKRKKIRVSFRVWQRELLHNRVMLMMVERLCSAVFAARF